MAHITETGRHATRGLTETISDFFAGWMDAMSRHDEVAKLQRMSDRDLSDMGIAREDIVRHVFRDRVGF